MRIRPTQLESFLASPLADFCSWVDEDGTSPQGEFIRAAADHRIRIFRAGNRAGKTTCGAVDTLLHCLGWHPCSRFDAPVKWWVSGLSWDVVGEVLWPVIDSFLPRNEVKNITWMRKKIPLEIEFKNGSILRFKSAESRREKFQGAKLHGVWIDEEQPREIVEECRARLMDYGGYMTVTLTPIRRSKWVMDLENEPGVISFRTSMMAAARAGLLDIGEVERFAEALPERQRKVRVYGEFVALEGQVYPDLSRETHMGTVVDGQLVADGKILCSWPPPAHWPRFAAIDWGVVNPTAVLVAVEDPHKGRLMIERCYYASGIRASRWAELLEERLPPLRFPLVSDHDAQARLELRSQGMSTIAAEKDIDRGLEAVERMLVRRCDDGAPALVFVCDGAKDRKLGRCDAEKVLWEAELYHYPENRDGKPDPRDLPVKKDDHAMDALRYLVVAWERRSGGPPKPPTIKPKRRQGYDPRLRMNKEAWL